MAGGMVETRLGMTAAAHVACALGGVDFVDLDTAWLLADDPYAGGYEADGPSYTMPRDRRPRRRGARGAERERIAASAMGSYLGDIDIAQRGL